MGEGFVGLVIITVASIWLWENHKSIVIMGGVCIVIFIMWGIISSQNKAIKRRERQQSLEIERRERKQSLEKLIAEEIQVHIQTLFRKWMQTVRKDEYGQYSFDKWFLEIDYFIDQVLLPKYVDLMDYIGRGSIVKSINEAVHNYELEELENGNAYLCDVEEMSPIEFEQHCAELLEIEGWNTQITPPSGDQGVDIVASKGAVVAAIQCKKYASPVGNAAVQEIFAGKSFVSADYAVVVSNAPFTRQAKQLAGTCGVQLLHYTDLTRLEHILLS